MLDEQLKRVFRLVGEITTQFNCIELLWYLIFTCLVPAKREVLDVIINQHKTGGGQRKMIREVAAVILPREPDGSPGELLAELTRLDAVTNDLAGRRNHVIHSVIEIADFIIPPRIVAIGTTRPTALSGKDVETELADLFAVLELHVLDMDELRLKMVGWTNPKSDLTPHLLRIKSQKQALEDNNPKKP